MTIDYNSQNIRTLLTKGFSVGELRNFCFDQPDFKPVYEQLAEDSGKNKIIQQLIEYAEQKELFGLLLDWAKEQNPSKYEMYQPYHIHTISSGAYGKSQRAINLWIIIFLERPYLIC